MTRRMPQIFKKDDKTKEITKVSPSEAKKFIMSVHGWTAEEYTKKRDIFKNKLRAFESFQRAQGKDVKPQNVVEILYKQASNMKKYGADYEPTQALKRIEAFSAVSITKGRKQAAAKGRAYQQINLRQLVYVSDRFKQFIKVNDGARAIVEKFNKKAKESGKPVNATKLEEALADYANALHAIIDPPKKKKGETNSVSTSQIIPSGETYGSDSDLSFNVDDYLTDDED